MSDLISRQWLLDLYGEYIDGDAEEGKALFVPLEVVRQNIKDAPSAEARQDSDFISREDAVNAVHKFFADEINKQPHAPDEDGDDVYTDMKTINSLLYCNKYISKALKTLPSATSQNLAKPNNSDDLINRQDAMDAIERMYVEEWYESDTTFNQGLGTALEEIKALPSSALSEDIVRCKDCQYADFKCPYPTCNLLEMNITEQSFCSWTKMKGGTE